MSEEATTEAEAKTFDAKITELGDSIASLTLKEAVDLADYMKDAYGIEPAAGGAVMMAGPGGGDEGGGGAEEQTEFDVILTGDGSSGANAPLFFQRLGQFGRFHNGQRGQFFYKLGNVSHDVSLQFGRGVECPMMFRLVL